MNFLMLHVSGRPILVNTRHIVRVDRANNGAAALEIEFQDDPINVDESFNDVEQYIFRLKPQRYEDVA